MTTGRGRIRLIALLSAAVAVVSACAVGGVTWYLSGVYVAPFGPPPVSKRLTYTGIAGGGAAAIGALTSLVLAWTLLGVFGRNRSGTS
jgi:hypothetical protein